MDLVGIRTGTANVASVGAAFERLGRLVDWDNSPAAVRSAPAVVLPGVGTFGAAMQQLARDGVVEALQERIDAGRPTLAICLGLQLLGTASEESPGVAGLGVLDARTRRLQDVPRIPHMGWNTVSCNRGDGLLSTGTAYFANSFALDTVPAGWRGARAPYGGPMVAAVEKGAVLACQFHPELSGAWGADLLAAWLRRAEEA